MLIYNGNNKRVIEAVAIVNDKDFQEALCNEIANKEYFDMSTADSKYLSLELMAFLKCVNIEVRLKRGWFWSKWLAAFYPSNPFFIYLNSKRLNRSVASIVGSCVHELIHSMDHFDTTYSYGHGGNTYHSGLNNTAPYWIGRKAKELV